MTREREGVITMEAEDFKTIEGSPYYPAYIVGETGDQLVPSRYRVAFIDGEPWVAFDYVIGPLEYVRQKVDELNNGIGLDEELQGSRFAVGPNYNWNSVEEKMVRDTSREFAYRVWINKQPTNNQNDIVKIEEVHNYV